MVGDEESADVHEVIASALGSGAGVAVVGGSVGEFEGVVDDGTVIMGVCGVESGRVADVVEVQADGFAGCLVGDGLGECLPLTHGGGGVTFGECCECGDEFGFVVGEYGDVVGVDVGVDDGDLRSVARSGEPRSLRDGQGTQFAAE
jgi:hypothetical protein